MPVSARDLDRSVDFLKDILKNETRTRSPGNFDDPISKLPTRSFHSDTARGAGGRQDATVYKHNDDHTPPGGVYQPRSRHIDRDTVRTRSDDPTDDLSVMKRQLENTAKMLDRTTEENAARTREDDELEREMSDLRYRIKRLQDDLDYVSRGPRSYAKDDERRKLERELLHLMHEKLPDLEKRIEENQARKDKEKREQIKDRDRRNDRSGRFSDRDDEYSRRYDDEDRYRGSYSRDRSRERDRPRDDYDRRDYDRRDRNRDFDRSRDDDRNRDYRRPPQDTRSPPPPPPNPPSNSISQPPPAPPPPSSTPANMAKMTKEERQAYIKAEAQRQIQERMKALGVTTSASTPSIDSSVVDRLAQEKKEAEEKARAAEKAEEERARARQERLANEKAIKEGKNLEQPSPAPAPTPTVSSPAKPPAPPPPKSRARPPPPPTKPSRPAAPPAPTPPVLATSEPPPPPQPDPEEERIKRLEEESRKRREAMQARLRALEEEENVARSAEAEIEKRRQALSSRTPVESPSTPVPPPPPPPPQPVQPVVQTPVPPASPAPEPQKSIPVDKPSFNPFSRIKKEEPSPSIAPSPPVTTSGGSTNPFFRSQTAPPPVAPAPPPSTSPAPKSYYNTADDDTDEEWGEVVEKDEDDSSDDEFTSSRAKRTNLAEKFFGNILPPVRPQSAGPGTVESPRSPAPTTSDAAPPPPPPAPAPPTFASVDDIPPPPGPPPPPPPGPPPPAQTSAPLPQPTVGRGALLNAIQGGARLRKAVTNDRSGSAISGKVIGEAAPPVHINTAVDPPSPPAPAPALDPRHEHSFPESFNPPSMLSEDTKSSHRLSVDWYAGLAADQGTSRAPTLTSMREEEEDVALAPATSQPVFNIQDTSEHVSADLMDDVDRSVGEYV